jgi:hypothetical protein
MISNIEHCILRGLTHDETYTRKVLPYVKDVYFETSVGRTLFELCEKYFSEYNNTPTSQAIAIEIEKISGLTDEEFRSLGELCESLFGEQENQDLAFLIDETER